VIFERQPDNFLDFSYHFSVTAGFSSSKLHQIPQSCTADFSVFCYETADFLYPPDFGFASGKSEIRGGGERALRVSEKPKNPLVEPAGFCLLIG